MVQRAQDLGGKMDHLFPGQGTAALLEIFFEGDAIDILHDNVLKLIGDGDIINLDNIGMVQNGNGLGLIFEAANQLLIVQKLFLEDLDRDGIAGSDVLALIYIGHAAHADQAFNQVAAIQLSADEIIHLFPPLSPHPSKVR